jgi:hypothetical protein
MDVKLSIRRYEFNAWIAVYRCIEPTDDDQIIDHVLAMLD